MIVKLRLTNGKDVGTTFIVWKSPFLVGRHEKCDLRVGSPQVSLHHCLVSVHDGAVWVRDLDSTNGTFLDKKRVDGDCRVGLGECLHIGPAIFEVLQEATGVIALDDRDEYTPTQPAVQAVPPRPGPPRPTAKKTR